MQVTPVDKYHNLFLVQDIMTPELCQKVAEMPWLDMPWQRQQGQEQWPRRRILNENLPWFDEWNNHINSVWPVVGAAIGRELAVSYGTTWWLDEPGFTCDIHTDGELPGAMQMVWIAPGPHWGTCFYHNKKGSEIRQQFLSAPNQGYIMVNFPRPNGYTHLHWHAMLNPVPEGTFRLSSYTLIAPQ